MKTVTKTFTVQNSWGNLYAEGHYSSANGGAIQEGDKWYCLVYVIADKSASAFLTLDISEIPASAVIKSCHVTYKMSYDSGDGMTTRGITTPDISGSGSVDDRVLNYLVENAGIQSVRFGVYHSFINNAAERGGTFDKQADAAAQASFLNGRYILAQLYSATVNLEITYEQDESSTISYGANNAYQKCNIYFGTGGSWQKCKAHFGIDGAWKEVK